MGIYLQTFLNHFRALWQLQNEMRIWSPAVNLKVLEKKRLLPVYRHYLW
jgi:hypothetical protein